MDQTISSIQPERTVTPQTISAPKIRDTGYFEIAFGISTLLLFAVILYGTFATLG
jgi:hypothetical protein